MNNYYIKGDFIKSQKKFTISRKFLKKAILKTLKIFVFVFAFAGCAIIAGAVGSSDVGEINTIQLLKKIIEGFFLCGFAWVLNFIKLIVK